MGDEIYAIGTARSFTWLSYLGGYSGEGNSAPLYFWLIKGIGLFSDSTIAYRLVSILPTSVFVWLSCKGLGRFGWLVACVLVNTYFVDLYGCNARHYALWVLGTWWLVSGCIERTRWFVVGSYMVMLTTPFGFFQVACCLVWMKRVPLILVPGLVYGAFLVYMVPEYPFIWPGLWRFIELGGHHFTWWICIPLVAFLLKDKRYWWWFVLQLGLFGLVVYSFYTHRVEQLMVLGHPGFVITERYFVWMLPMSLYFLLEYIKELLYDETCSSYSIR